MLPVVVGVESSGPFCRFYIQAQGAGRVYLGVWVERDAHVCAEVGITIAEAKGWKVVEVRL